MMRAPGAVALRDDFFAPPSDVARWVVGTFGAELQARRLAALDASRRGRGAERPRPLPDADRLSEPPPPPASPAPDGPPSSGPDSRDDHYSRTIVLAPIQSPLTEQMRNRILVGAAVVSFIAVLLALLFPQ